MVVTSIDSCMIRILNPYPADSRRRPPQPFSGTGEKAAQAQASCAVSQLVFHGCQMPWYADVLRLTASYLNGV